MERAAAASRAVWLLLWSGIVMCLCCRRRTTGRWVNRSIGEEFEGGDKITRPGLYVGIDARVQTWWLAR